DFSPGKDYIRDHGVWQETITIQPASKLEICASQRKQFWEEDIEDFLNLSDDDEDWNEEVISYAAKLHQEFFQLARVYGEHEADDIDVFDIQNVNPLQGGQSLKQQLNMLLREANKELVNITRRDEPSVLM
ncbi:Hypothetical predicted protein, partial [Paramuricea clavata]